MDSSNSDNSIKDINLSNSNRCKICEGVGLVKNNNFKCENCNGFKCKNFTGNPIDYVPWESCYHCKSTGYKICIKLNDELKNRDKISCSNCSGNGFTKKKLEHCSSCEISHEFCFCYKIISPYVECIDCEGSGSIIN